MESEEQTVRTILAGIEPLVSGSEYARARAIARNALFAETNVTRVGRYTVLDRLGAGTSGIVYAAYDPQLDRRVALKVLRDAAQRSPETALQEARAGARVVHPNLVTVYEVGRDLGETYIAMQLIDGGSLRAWLADGSRGIDEIRSVLLQAGRGLAAAHDQELVHRDFKPDNVLVDTTGVAFVADFGLARLVDTCGVRTDDGSGTASAGAGTPAYMSPEQRAGYPATVRSDQYAYCVTAFEALTGARPFTSAGPGAGSTAKALVDTDTPARWKDAILRGLSRDPEARWPSMHELLAQLQPPKRSPRALTLAVGIVIASGGIGLAYAFETAGALEQCAAADDAMAQLWHARRREEVRSLLKSSGVAGAPETADRVATAIDEYARTWTSANRDVCVRAQTASDWTETTTARAKDCLRSQRIAVETMVDALRSDPAGYAHISLRAVVSLASPKACLDRVLLDRRSAPPEDEAAARQQEALSRDLLEHRLLRARGRYVEALALAQSNQARAKGQHEPSIRTTATLGLASSLADVGRYQEVGTLLDAALTAAWRAGDDHAFARLTLELAQHQGIRLARIEDGARWLALAEASLSRAPTRSDLRLRYLEVATAFARERGAEAQWLAFATERVVAAEDLFGAQHPSAGDAWLDLAEARNWMRHNAEAIDASQRALDIYNAALGERAPAVADARRSLAQGYWNSARFEEGLAELERAHSMTLAGPQPGNVEAAGIALSLAQLLLEVGDLERAQTLLSAVDAVYGEAYGQAHPKYAELQAILSGLYSRQARFEEAYAVAEEARETVVARLGPLHPQVATSLIARAQVERARALPKQAAETLGEAAAIYAAIEMPRDRRYADFLDLRAEVYADGGEFGTALALFEEAEAVYRAMPGPLDPRVGVLVHDQAWVLLLAKDFEAALPRQLQAHRLRSAEGTDPRGIASSLLQLGIISFRLGDMAQAKHYTELAVKQIEVAYRPEEADRGISLNAAARTLLALDPERSLQLLERALPPLELPTSPPFALAAAHWTMARAYAEQGDMRRAVEFGARAVPVLRTFEGDVEGDRLEASLAKWRRGVH